MALLGEQDTAVAAEDASSPAVDSETTRRESAKRYAMEAAAMRTTLAQSGIGLLVATFPGYPTLLGEAAPMTWSFQNWNAWIFMSSI